MIKIKEIMTKIMTNQVIVNFMLAIIIFKVKISHIKLVLKAPLQKIKDLIIIINNKNKIIINLKLRLCKLLWEQLCIQLQKY